MKVSFDWTASFVAGALMAVWPTLSLFAAPRSQSVLLVFAHPDDEISVAPLTAHLSRKGVDVSMIFVTSGEQGVRMQPSINAGPELGKVREAEARCSSRALRAKPPQFLGFANGELGKSTIPPSGYLKRVRDSLERAIAKRAPQVIITWGPDGFYGHPEHMLVSAATTRIVQRMTDVTRPRLFYVGLPEDRVHARPSTILPWEGTDRRLLTARVQYDPRDIVEMRAAMLCHKTQFNDAEANLIVDELVAIMGGFVYLRPALQMPSPDRLFSR